jgi:hypothetical protein
LADRGTHYQQLHGHNIHAKKIELAPYTYGKQLLTWEQAHLYPINLTIVSAQAVRFMLLSDKYYLSWKWAAADHKMGIPASTLAALRRIHFNFRRDGEVDVWDIAFVLSKGQSDSSTMDEMRERQRAYDTMSLNVVRKKAKRVLRVMQNSGDVDPVDIDVDEIDLIDTEDNASERSARTTDSETLSGPVPQGRKRPRDNKEGAEADEDWSDGNCQDAFVREFLH